MRVLGVDYGKAKIGLSIGDTRTKLAEPLSVVKGKNPEEFAVKIERIVGDERVEKIVVGVSDGVLGKESERFGEMLSEQVRIPVEFQDETLSSKDAQRMSIEAGIQRKKRQRMEDAYAASLVLQSWMDKLA